MKTLWIFCSFLLFVIPLQAQVRSGMVSREIYSSNNSDTSVLLIEYEYFENKEHSYQDTVNVWIKQIIGHSESDEEEMNDYFFESILLGFIEEYKKYSDDYESMPWSLEQQVHIDDSNEGYVQLIVSGWTYQGGAHGDGFYSVFVFDKKDGIRLELKDIFSDLNELSTLGEFYFRFYQEIGEEATLEESGYDFNGEGFYLNDNFSFTDEGLEFVYNSYEIAPYSMGPSEFVIPYEEIEHLFVRKMTKQ